MNVTIKRIGVVRAGSVAGLVYACIAVLILPFFLYAAAGSGEGIAATLLTLVLYPILGFFGGMLAAAIYNLVAGWTGGIELVLSNGYGRH